MSRPHGDRQVSRPWPVVVRRARPADREPIVRFASATFDGWDYIPHAFDVWLHAPDGVLLVAAAGRLADGSVARDANGQLLAADQPVAVARVALASADEAWLEGIRVDPRIRGMDVATDLQVAELQWAAARGVRVVRYATGERNDASHRLGARHGFELLTALRTYAWTAGAVAGAQRPERGPSGFELEVRKAASARRAALLARLRGQGSVAAADGARQLWASLVDDPTFMAGARLYEPRSWALQELTSDLFTRHLAAGEVLVAGDPRARWALAVLPREARPAEDVSLHLALLAGDGELAIELAGLVRRVAQEPIRFRLPDPAPLLAAGVERLIGEEGFVPREWVLHLLARAIDEQHPPPEPDPARLVVEL
jgi:GNAT superfamily N-acetyltransferase